MKKLVCLKVVYQIGGREVKNKGKTGMKKTGFFRLAAICLTILALNGMLNPIKAFAASEEVTLSVSSVKGTGEATEAFSVTNMFPGDSVSKEYCLKVTCKENITVKFHADIHNGYEKLAEVLKCKVALQDSGTEKILYDGLMKDMPVSVDVLLQAESKTTKELPYVITAYLDTSVTNDYQNKALKADFRWWVEYEAEEPEKAEPEGSSNSTDSDTAGNVPGTGDNEKGLLWMMTMMIAAGLIYVCGTRARKEANHEIRK